MMTELSLRARFVLGIVLCTGVTLVLLASWGFWLSERVEQSLLNDIMRTNLRLYAQALEHDPLARPPPEGTLQFYRAGSAGMPEQLASLAPGCHRGVAVGDRKFQVLVQDVPAGRIFVAYDLTTHLERRANGWRWFYPILAVALLFIFLTARWASRSILAPVTGLAERLSSIDPRRRNVRLGADFSRHEMAPIAASVDRLLERMDKLVEREQSFTSTASHELRTPLAVIQGATEILAEQTRDKPAAQKALQRMRRAEGEMSEFIQALLLLSREQQIETEPGEYADVAEIVPRVIEDLNDQLDGRPVQMACQCDATLRVQAPRSLVTIVVSNLFRNAIAHTMQGSITCALRDRTLEIRDTGSGIAPEHMQQVFDRNFTTRPGGYGVGLYLSKRICDRFGWQIDLSSTPQGTTASVTF
jgi:signal transduction histidine kinase